MKQYGLPFDIFEESKRILQERSPRTRVIQSVALLDLVIKCALQNHFAKGNAKSRQMLFEKDGVFSSLSSKTNACYCAGWISADVFHDIEVLRRLRNDCAHDVNDIDLNDTTLSKRLEVLRTPHRKYHDWGRHKIAFLPDGSLSIFSGETPAGATNTRDFTLPGSTKYWLAFPVLLLVVIAELEVPLAKNEQATEVVIVDLPEFMKEAQAL